MSNKLSCKRIDEEVRPAEGGRRDPAEEADRGRESRTAGSRSAWPWAMQASSAAWPRMSPFSGVLTPHIKRQNPYPIPEARPRVRSFPSKARISGVRGETGSSARWIGRCLAPDSVLFSATSFREPTYRHPLFRDPRGIRVARPGPCFGT